MLGRLTPVFMHPPAIRHGKPAADVWRMHPSMVNLVPTFPASVS